MFVNEFTKDFSSDNFESDVLQSDLPVLVDFWAEWCGPCKALTPTIDSIAEEYSSKVTVGKVNIDQHPTIAAKYGVRSIPTLLIYSGGQVYEQLVGAVPKSQITAILDQLI